MKKELQNKLYAKYPKIFKQKDLDMKQSCMYWGIAVGDGWYPIIEFLCGSIQSYIDNTSHYVSTSWSNFVYKTPRWCARILLKLPFQTTIKSKPIQIEATQVKEKFGTLRFYTNGGDDYVYGMIRMAEHMSSVTCEICGADGTLGGESWLSTRCEKHKQSKGIWNPVTEEYVYE